MFDYQLPTQARLLQRPNIAQHLEIVARAAILPDQNNAAAKVGLGAKKLPAMPVVVELEPGLAEPPALLPFSRQQCILAAKRKPSAVLAPEPHRPRSPNPRRQTHLRLEE